VRPYFFFVALIAAGVSGYGWWTILGDSWLMASVSGTFWGWIACVIANLGPPVPMNVVSARHPARFDKLQQKGR